jgi:hypothetical protein
MAGASGRMADVVPFTQRVKMASPPLGLGLLVWILSGVVFWHFFTVDKNS